VAAADGMAQRHAEHTILRSIPAEILQRPAPLVVDRGAAHEPINTVSTRAQAYYDQGLAALHSYEWIDAARAFYEASRLDGAAAMPHLGLSFALTGLGAIAEARREADTARALASPADRHDRRRIDLRALQLESVMGGTPSAAGRYAAALDGALADAPRDVELLLLRGQAEDGPADHPGMSASARATTYFERAAAAAPGYFAPHHYLIHAYENDNRLEDARPHAEAYARLAPGVPHAHHMYAHVLRRIGRVTDAIAQLRTAYDLEVARSKADAVPREYNWHYQHNLDLLGVSYQYIGQLTNAEPLLREASQLPAASAAAALNMRDWPAFRLAHRSPAAARAAAQQLVAHEWPSVRALGHMDIARVHLALGQTHEAAGAIDAALRELRDAGQQGEAIAPDFRLLQGEFFLQAGERARGAAMVRAAVVELTAASDADAWAHTLFTIEAAGRFARSSGDWALASDLADALLQHDSAYAGGHYALGLAAEQRGDLTVAKREYTAAVARWADADRDFQPVEEARARLARLVQRAR
jgi:tetratricopeptide (TPR) repeat protein